MVTTSFKCSNVECKQVFDVTKNTVEENFESSYKCPFCNSLETCRIWGIGDVAVASGMLGNSTNGFENNVTKMPGKYGSFKGKVVRSIK